MYKRKARVNHCAGIVLCPHCGRELDFKEVCECMQDTKDGLRAVCPDFKARTSYSGVHYIVCRRKLRFATQELRNLHYREFCCGQCAECAAGKNKEGSAWMSRIRRF